MVEQILLDSKSHVLASDRKAKSKTAPTDVVPAAPAAPSRLAKGRPKMRVLHFDYPATMPTAVALALAAAGEQVRAEN